MSNSNIKDMLVDIQKVLEATDTIVSSMPDGSRTQISKLAEQVSLAIGRDVKEVLAYVDDYAHRTTTAYVARGKKGGLIKGSRPVKVVKPAKVKAVKADDSASE